MPISQMSATPPILPISNTSLVHIVSHPLFLKHNVTIFIKRDEQLHGVVSGNKWRKLKYNLHCVSGNPVNNVITFGGAFSNHIHATAFACYQKKIKSIGIIRGEENNQNNYTLSWAKHWGMELIFVDRKTYRLRNDKNYLTQLQQQYPGYYIVPEGGSNSLALQGVAEVIDELNQQIEFDTLITPVGSGGTLAGLILGDKGQHNLLGVSVLKQAEYINEQITELLPEDAKQYENWQVMQQYHCGGYAKFSQQDALKIREFSQVTNIDFEPVYSGKMILALLDLVESGYFPAGHRIVLLHTGGLQGLGGMFERGLLNKNEWPTLPTKPLSSDTID